jgi:pimeloyl-ACP methyl ester carboxylesterase
MPADYYTAVHDARAGTPIDVGFIRNGVERHANVTLGTASDEADPGVKTVYGNVSVDNSLRRTLVTLPENPAGKVPAVLMIGGIGCFSVDVAANPNDAYLHLAHDLSRAGYAVMRLEKSGVGDSHGPPCAKVDFEAERRGYEAALRALGSSARVDPQHVYLFGHSIGTAIAPQLATTNHHVAGVIVAEAVARDWPEYEIRNLRRQLELGGETPANVDRALLEKAQCMQKLLFENEPEAQIEVAMPSCSVHNGVYPVDPWYVRQVARLDIVEPWTRLNVPVLAIYGTADVITERADHERIVAIVNAVHPGLGSFVAIDNMSHLLALAASPKDAADAYVHGKPQPYSKELSQTIIEWLNRVSSKGRV